jgi:uncharacterized repeat protein (TIGR03803 family)
MDSKGNLYGTTMLGGANSNGTSQGNGTVFELTPNGSGGWTETILHSFNGTDGTWPTSGLILDAAGNLYGTTRIYGLNYPNFTGYGTVFELSPPKKIGGAWTVSALLDLNGADGSAPQGELTMDAGGNLYGTAQRGGAYGAGTAFKLSKSGTTWTPSVLYNFTGGSDGSTPLTSLIMDSGGNLYSTTKQGGIYGAGTVFELTPSGPSWSELVLDSFAGGTTDGSGPSGNVMLGAPPLTSGNLYGVTEKGGTSGAGTVFSLSASGGIDSILYNFTGGADGSGPLGVIEDGSGNLFGTTRSGGASGMGTVFELTPGGSLITLCAFNGANGSNPTRGLMMDSNGNLYGTTPSGGPLSGGSGTVFKLTKSGGTWTQSVLYSFIF